MARPLYVGCEATLGSDGNTGLWYDKFCDTWETKGASDAGEFWSMAASGSASSGKTGWVGKVAGGRCGASVLLEEVSARLARLALADGGRVGVFETTSRFVTGLGRSHPVENGFAWHPTLGAPFLPGSSLKGLVRAWAEEEAGKGEQEVVKRIFGDRGRVGSVCFLDAIPVKPVILEADVITPHAAGWDAKNPPGDWRSPVPIPFLVTAAGTKFLFTLVPRANAEEKVIDRVWEWLRAALEFSGAGAKTAVGYGRFALDESATEKLLRSVSPPVGAGDGEASVSGWVRRIQGLAEEEVLGIVRRVMEGKEKIEDPGERQDFIEAVFATGWVPKWKQGKKTDPATQVGTKKLKERAKWLIKERENLG